MPGRDGCCLHNLAPLRPHPLLPLVHHLHLARLVRTPSSPFPFSLVDAPRTPFCRWNKTLRRPLNSNAIPILSISTSGRETGDRKRNTQSNLRSRYKQNHIVTPSNQNSVAISGEEKTCQIHNSPIYLIFVPCGRKGLSAVALPPTHTQPALRTMGLIDTLRAKYELYRLEQRYTRREKRTTFASGAQYVDGEYIYTQSAAFSPTSAKSSASFGDNGGQGGKNRMSIVAVKEVFSSSPSGGKRSSRAY